MQSIFIGILAALTLVSVSLQRTYAAVSLKQLKYRARSGDELARALLLAVNYGSSLRAVLWLLIALCSSGFFILLALSAPTWFALSASVVLIWLGFVWIPAARVTYVSEKVARLCAPLLARALVYLNPIIERLARFVRRYRPLHIHTGLYDRQDLINLLEQQQVQSDNRIEQVELDVALNALKFGDEQTELAFL